MMTSKGAKWKNSRYPQWTPNRKGNQESSAFLKQTWKRTKIMNGKFAPNTGALVWFPDYISVALYESKIATFCRMNDAISAQFSPFWPRLHALGPIHHFLWSLYSWKKKALRCQNLELMSHLKVSKSRNQIILSSHTPKNQRNFSHFLP